MFKTVVVLGFLGSVVNYYLIGIERTNRLVFLFVLSCFVVTETMIALHQPIYWLYVALNMWGIYCVWKREDERHD